MKYPASKMPRSRFILVVQIDMAKLSGNYYVHYWLFLCWYLGSSKSTGVSNISDPIQEGSWLWCKFGEGTVLCMQSFSENYRHCCCCCYWKRLSPANLFGLPRKRARRDTQCHELAIAFPGTDTLREARFQDNSCHALSQKHLAPGTIKYTKANCFVS